MQHHWIASIITTLALACLPALFAQTPESPEPAKSQAARATPDLSGVWMGEQGFGFVTKEPIPMQPWAKEAFEYNTDPFSKSGHGRDEMDPRTKCLPVGPTPMMNYPYPFEIIQIPGRVIMLYEWDHWVRQIWIDGRGHPSDLEPRWMGHSIGKWDGDTLVIDTVNLKDRNWLDGQGHVHSDALHIVERLKRVAPDTLEDEITFDDPKAYTKPWTAKAIMKLHPKWEIGEDVICEDRLVNKSAP